MLRRYACAQIGQNGLNPVYGQRQCNAGKVARLDRCVYPDNLTASHVDEGSAGAAAIDCGIELDHTHYGAAKKGVGAIQAAYNPTGESVLIGVVMAANCYHFIAYLYGGG